MDSEFQKSMFLNIFRFWYEICIFWQKLSEKNAPPFKWGVCQFVCPLLLCIPKIVFLGYYWTWGKISRDWIPAFFSLRKASNRKKIQAKYVPWNFNYNCLCVFVRTFWILVGDVDFLFDGLVDLLQVHETHVVDGLP